MRSRVLIGKQFWPHLEKRLRMRPRGTDRKAILASSGEETKDEAKGY